MEELISFKNVTKYYGNVMALNELTFSINEREIVALVGNNGCGKTTTVNVLCNLIPYEKGEVFVFDKQLTPFYVSYKNRIGFLLSPPIFVNEFSPVEYLRFICKFQGVNRENIESRIKDIIETFEISDSKKKKISDLSAGNKMKIAFASAIIHNPQIVILDEPFIHLDIRTIDLIMNLLSSFRNIKTIFITSHNLDLVLDLCERILLMADGQIIEDLLKTNNLTNEMFKQMIKQKLSLRNKKIKIFDWL